MMKLLLLCLGLTLVCAHGKGNHRVVTNNIDVRKLAGEWYTILLASNFKEAIKENGLLRVFLDYVEFLNNSSPVLKFHVKINDDCVPVFLVANKTSENGVYKIRYPGLDTIHVMEAVYDDYMIVHFYNSDSESPFFVFGLYARTPDESSTTKKHFAKIAQEYGIPRKNVFDLTQTALSEYFLT